MFGGISFLFNLWWYGRFVSFPLFGEDGAHSYSTLMEAVHYSRLWSVTIPLKWFEGLGEPNFFISAAFDRFSWVMFSGMQEADAF